MRDGREGVCGPPSVHAHRFTWKVEKALPVRYSNFNCGRTRSPDAHGLIGELHGTRLLGPFGDTPYTAAYLLFAYALIEAEKANFPIRFMCTRLEVSTSGSSRLGSP